MLTREQLTALANVEAPPVVSIFLPTHEKARETRQDPIRLKNALAAVSDRLLGAGHRRPEVEQLLRGASDLLEDELFWRHQRRGLALFAAPGLFQHHRVPIELEELQVVAARPYVKPLLPLLADDGRYHVLAASAGATRLYQGARFGLEELDLDLPGGVGEVSAETDYQNMRHAAPQARPRQGAPVGMPATHNFGESPEEQRKAQLVEHLRRVHDALEEHLGGTRAPLVLVAAPEVRGHLRALATGISFHDEDLQVDPSSLDDAELHRRTYELVQPVFARSRREALDRFAALAGSGDARAATDPATVVSAARSGRVDSLLAAAGARLWGRHDAERDRTRIEGGSSPDNEELLDLACLHTLLNGGHVHVLPAGEMPLGGPLAAILRF
jgi:hypothetical protein